MNCLYFGKRDNLHPSKEHIFPALIGGKKTLEKNCVSKEANQLFSKYENKFAYKSIITLPRSLFGPGHRGNYNEYHEDKGCSEIQVVYDEKSIFPYLFSVIAEGIQVTIPQIIVEDGKASFLLSQGFKKFKNPKDISEYSKEVKIDKVIRIETDLLLPDNYTVIGFFKDFIFYASKEILKKDYIIQLLSSINNENLINRAEIEKSNPSKFSYKFIYDSTFLKVLAKTLLNVLCNEKGKEYVQKNCSKIINWIIDESDNNMYGSIIPNPFSNLKTIFPEFSHWAIINIIDHKIVGFISIYDYTFLFNLGYDPNKDSIYPPISFICDYKNGKEMTLLDLI